MDPSEELQITALARFEENERAEKLDENHTKRSFLSMQSQALAYDWGLCNYQDQKRVASRLTPYRDALVEITPN